MGIFFVKKQWRIKSQRLFNDYTSKGYVFFVICLASEPLPFTFVVVAICDGVVEYYDTQDYEQFEDLKGGNGIIVTTKHIRENYHKK